MIALNWRRGAFRLWLIASVLWCVGMFSAALLGNKDVRWSPAEPPVVHVRLSNTVTWDYPPRLGRAAD